MIDTSIFQGIHEVGAVRISEDGPIYFVNERVGGAWVYAGTVRREKTWQASMRAAIALVSP